MNTYFISLFDAKLSYTSMGSGSNILLTFHGFGQDKLVFVPIAEALQNDYTIYSFDLFFHGESTWKDKKQLLTKTIWKEFITHFLHKHNIQSFSIMGFSMGAKFALSILESFPKMVNKIILVAPDGIKTNFWYSIATYPNWTKSIFKTLVFKPKVYYRVGTILYKLRLVNKGIIRFAESQLNSREKQLRVFYAWLAFKELQFNMKEIATIINSKNISLTMFLGKYDKIITLKNMQKLLTQVKDYQLIILPTGHNHLLEKIAEHLKINTL